MKNEGVISKEGRRDTNMYSLFYVWLWSDTVWVHVKKIQAGVITAAHSVVSYLNIEMACHLTDLKQREGRKEQLDGQWMKGKDGRRQKMGEFQIQDKSLNLGSTISCTRARDFGQSLNLSEGQLFHLGCL